MAHRFSHGKTSFKAFATVATCPHLSKCPIESGYSKTSQSIDISEGFRMNRGDHQPQGGCGCIPQFFWVRSWCLLNPTLWSHLNYFEPFKVGSPNVVKSLGFLQDVRTKFRSQDLHIFSGQTMPLLLALVWMEGVPSCFSTRRRPVCRFWTREVMAWLVAKNRWEPGKSNPITSRGIG